MTARSPTRASYLFDLAGSLLKGFRGMTFPGPKPFSARVIFVLLPIAVAVGLVACGKHGSAANSAIPKLESTNANAPVGHYSYEVVNAWPHDRSAFTQGLVYHDGDLLESTGL